jgi:UDP-N-acetyl-D-mannosaminuronate dehydrogenase
MHAITLPYCNDLRSIAHGQPAPVPELYLDTMKAIVKRLQFKGDLSWSDPKIDILQANIKAMALDDDAEEVIDSTLPDFEFISSANEDIQKFVEFTDISIQESTFKHKMEQEETTNPPKKVKTVDEHVFEIEFVKERIRKGQLKKYTVLELKTILKNAKVTITDTKKDLLMDQVNELYS